MNEDVMESSDHLAHYGILRKSGRYPYGSGQNGAAPFPWSVGSTENVRNRRFLEYFDAVAMEAKNQGKSTSKAITETCQLLGISTTEYRAARSLAKNQQKQVQIHTAQRLRDKGWSPTQIAEKMYGSKSKESTVRSLLNEDTKRKAQALENISNMLEEGVRSKRFIDVGTGVEQHLGISPDRLKVAVQRLKEKGYMVHKVQVDQLGTAPGNKTTIRVLCPPGTTYKDVNSAKSQIQQLDALGKFSKDNGASILGVKPPLSISSKRIGIRYAEDGGGLEDGVIHVRPGVPDLSLGASHYAQVRIMVDNSHFLKGMAVHKTDLPPGVDLQFNVNKLRSEVGTDKLAVMKPLKKLEDGSIDMDNPFGSQIKRHGQIVDPVTDKVTSVMNKLYEEGDWHTWSKSLASQFLSKQSVTLIRKQLTETYDSERQKLDEIMQLTNPAVKKKLLESFADGSDSSAVDLKAAALRGQASHVILPITKMKETEVYAPNFNNGDRVVLVRYPHGGTFEIPELTVNNRSKAARETFGEHPPDAIGIHPNVAKKMSGADFDGDSVLVIPQRPGTLIKHQDSLEQLATFDPQRQFPKYDGMKVMTEPQKQQHMGKISNLITDMTILGAPNHELARAVAHSMVVIDAVKHELDYKGSEEFHSIKALQRKYQPRPPGRPPGGSSTLISKAGARKDIRKQKPRPKSEGGPIDPDTGRLVFVPKGESFVNQKGKIDFPKQRTTQLADTHDAFTLVSKPGTQREFIYAEHSNRLKELANLARKETLSLRSDRQDPSAARAYDTEVKSLIAKLNTAIQNRPLERQAQVYANTTLAAKKADYPDMDDDQLKKVRFQALQQARDRTGAGKTQIDITPSEWQAIQARAISPSRLKTILDNANLDTVKKLATPRQTLVMTSSKFSRAQAMLAGGNTQAEVAQALGVSLTTLKNTLREGV